MSRRPVILLSHPLDAAAEARLADCADVRRPDDATPAGLRAALPGCDALVARTHVTIDGDLLAAAPRLRVIGVAGVGLDRVDLQATAAAGVRVLSTPAAASAAVAELTLALMLQLLRPIPRLAARYRAGAFRAARAHPHGDELGSLTVGVLGFGRIGSRVGRACASGLGARVLFHDIRTIAEAPAGCRPVAFETLLAESDLLTLHTPLTEVTRGWFDAATLARCRSGSRLINTARGEIIVTSDLVAALERGHLGGAALDVTAPEPLPVGHPLLLREDCIVTPHIAARTHGGLARMFGVVDDVLAALAEFPDLLVDLQPSDPGEER